MKQFPIEHRPKPTSYGYQFNHLDVHSGIKIALQETHAIGDQIVAGRFPSAFLLRNLPPGVSSPTTEAPTEEWLRQYLAALNEHEPSWDRFMDGLNGAIRRAQAVECRHV
jgi:hypothetical protein